MRTRTAVFGCGSAWPVLALLMAAAVMAQAPPTPAPPTAAPPTLDPVQAEAMARRRAAANAMPDSPGSGTYAATYDEDPTLPNHVVFHPIKLALMDENKLGVVVWGNGGCQSDGAASRQHLADLASYGYLVIAPGRIQSGPRSKAGAAPAPGAMPRPAGGGLPPPATTTDDVRAGLDWALAENARRGSAYYQRIDPKMVAVAGYSCGGLQALQLAVSDARIHAVVVQNSGLFPDGQMPIPTMTMTKSLLNQLRTPVIYIVGNKTDIAFTNANDDFSRIDKVPAVLASYQYAGHEGTYGEPHGGLAADVASDWLEWQLRGDESAGRSFIGPDCRLCTDAKWAVQRNAAFLQKTSGSTGGNVKMPRITQLPGKPTLSPGPIDLTAAGYVAEEYTVSGTAISYKEVAARDAGGRWFVQPDGSAPYATRIVVFRPESAQKFNGTVVVEWLNVTGGLDYNPFWSITKRELVRNGSAYVAVSAQRVGIEGGPSLTGSGQPLKKSNPERYGGLSHPGDAYSFDMYSQAAGLLRGAAAKKLLGGLKVQHVIGVGESQSAAYLTTYVNAVDPLARVFDGFLIHSRFGASPSLESPVMSSQAQAGVPGVKLRSDLRVPVLTFITETDVMGFGQLAGFSAARQPDASRVRVWEVAGTAHADAYLYGVSAIDSGTASSAALAAGFAPSKELRGMKLEKAYNNAPQHHYILQSAIAHLQNWVATGKLPPQGTPLELTGGGTPTDPVHLVLDEHANARGGVRSPWVDVPTSKLSGLGGAGGPTAALVGSVEPFDAQQLERLYPGDKSDYLRKFTASLDAAIKAGFILPADREEILGLASASYQRK
jgi:dienelactone hydrolase